MSEGPMLLLQRLVVARKTQSLAVEEAILNGCIQLRFAELFFSNPLQLSISLWNLYHYSYKWL